jgi:hypothetical protein
MWERAVAAQEAAFARVVSAELAADGRRAHGSPYADEYELDVDGLDASRYSRGPSRYDER